jgi:hypothetical protein
VKRGLRLVAIAGIVALAVAAGAKFFWLWINAAFAEASMSEVLHELGGLRGYLGFASDLQLAADPDLVIAEHAASRLLHHCEREDGMIELLKVEKRPAVQRWLMQSLAGCNSTKAIPLFREALHSQNSMIALVGAQSLGMLKTRAAIPELEELVGRCDPQCAGTAAYALSRMGERRVVYPWAVKALSAPKPQRDPGMNDHFQRYYAMKIIQEVGDRDDLRLLESNRDYIVPLLEFQDAESTLLKRGK